MPDPRAVGANECPRCGQAYTFDVLPVSQQPHDPDCWPDRCHPDCPIGGAKASDTRRYDTSPLYAEAQRREWCWCGEPSGHAGWLTCLDVEAARALTNDATGVGASAGSSKSEPPECRGCGLPAELSTSTEMWVCHDCRRAWPRNPSSEEAV